MLNIIISIIGLVLFICGIVLRCVKHVLEDSISKRMRTIMIIAGAVLMVLSQSFTIVPSNKTGIAVTFGQINQTPVRAGFKAKLPIFEEIALVDNRMKQTTLEEKCYSETNQQTVIFYEDVKITHQLPSESSVWVYSNVPNYEKELIDADMIASAVKASSVTLTDKEATNRAMIEPLITENLQKVCDQKYGSGVVRVISCVVGNADFTDEYNAAISAKNIAEMNEQTREVERRIAEEDALSQKRVDITKAEAAAEVKEEEARGEAEALYIIAQKQAEANELLTESMSDAILKSQFYEKWNGELPNYVGGENGGSFIFDMTE